MAKLPMTLKTVEFSTVTWFVSVPAGQTMKEILAPSYWQHVTRQLRPGHEVKILSEDRTLWAHLLVRDVGKNEAVMGVIQKVSFDTAERTDDETETEIKWRSPQSKYAVFRKSDGEVLKDGFETKEAAGHWAVERESGLAA